VLRPAELQVALDVVVGLGLVARLVVRMEFRVIHLADSVGLDLGVLGVLLLRHYSSLWNLRRARLRGFKCLDGAARTNLPPNRRLLRVGQTFSRSQRSRETTNGDGS